MSQVSLNIMGTPVIMDIHVAIANPSTNIEFDFNETASLGKEVLAWILCVSPELKLKTVPI